MIEARFSSVTVIFTEHGSSFTAKGKTAEGSSQPGGRTLGRHRTCAVLSQSCGALSNRMYIHAMNVFPTELSFMVFLCH